MNALSQDRLASHEAWFRSSGDEGTKLVARGEYLSGVDLSHAILAGADLSRTELSHASLYGADLTGADLTGADLYKTDLGRARLFGATLREAWSVRTDLYGADLTNADLTRAYLADINLISAVLRGAILTQADVATFIVSRSVFDVSQVAEMTGTIGFAEDPVTILEDGVERNSTVADLSEAANRRGALLRVWPTGERPPQWVKWRWGPSHSDGGSRTPFIYVDDSGEPT